MKSMLQRRRVIGALAVPVLFVTAGCMEAFYSDSQNAGRRNAQARQSALASMKLASSQAAPARPVTGQALVQLLSGNSHVEAYRKSASDAKPYVTHYDYYGADGTFVGRDTHARRTPAYQEQGRWSVKGDSLCIVKTGQENCYTVRLAADGAIQYWIDKPGDPFHGLLTRIVRTVRPGLQEPEYISDPAAFR
jgi:hypothetical protein